MKAIKTFFICLSLYWAQILMAPLYAQDTSTIQFSDQHNIDPANSSPVPSSEVVRGNEKNAKEKLGVAKSHILMFGTTFAGVHIARHCMKRVSSMVFMASALMYIGNETGLFAKYIDGSTHEMAYYHNGDHNKQVEALLEAANQTDNAAKAAKTKATFQTMTAAGFGIASILSITETARDWPTFTGDCYTNYNQKRESDFLYYSHNKPHFNPKEYIHSAKDEIDALIRMQEIGRLLNGEKQSIDLYTAKIKREKLTLDNIKGLKPALSLAAQIVIDTFFPQAQATTANQVGSNNKIGSKLAMLGIGGAAGYAITSSFTGSLGTNFQRVMSNGYTRAGVYGGFAAIATMAALDSKKVSDDLSSNANEYRRLAGQIQAKSSTTEGINPENTITQIQNQKIAKIGVGTTIGIENSSATCVSGGADLANAENDPNCSCRENNSCARVVLPALSQGKIFVPAQGNLTAATQAFADGANAAFSGNLGQAQLKSSEAANLAAKVMKAKPKYVALANQKIKSLGGTPVENWDAMEEKSSQYFMDQVNQAFEKLSPKERDALARLAPGLSAEQTRLTQTKKDLNGQAIQKVKNANGLKAISSRKIPQPEELGKPKFDSYEDEEEREQARMQAALADLKEQEKQRHKNIEGKQDASIASRDKNLFGLITKRYKKSAYKVFFSKDKLLP